MGKERMEERLRKNSAFNNGHFVGFTGTCTPLKLKFIYFYKFINKKFRELYLCIFTWPQGTFHQQMDYILYEVGAKYSLMSLPTPKGSRCFAKILVESRGN
jgi:hypothetical protein